MIGIETGSLGDDNVLGIGGILVSSVWSCHLALNPMN